MALSEARGSADRRGLRLEADRSRSSGLALSDAAGWNQSADDWALFIAAGAALGLRDADGRLRRDRRGAALRRRRRLDHDGAGRREAWRHRGWAPRLVAMCVAHAAPGRVACRCSTRRRPAPRSTAAAASSPASRFERWQGRAAARPIARPRDPGVDLGDRGRRSAALVALDRSTSGVDRARPARRVRRPAGDARLARPTTATASSSPAPAGARPRSGRSSRATTAHRARAARRARSTSSRARSSSTCRDAPAVRSQQALDARAASSRQRPFVRMALGATPLPRRSASPRVFAARRPGVRLMARAMATAAARLARTDALRARLFEGLAIPAHPLALDAERRLDARRQRALTRYYLDAGAGGLAVGVHTTQFAIREAGLYADGAARSPPRPRATGRATATRRRCSSPASAAAPPQARRRGAARARPRLPRRPAQPRGAQGRERRRADRPLRSRRRARCRWSASTCSRRSAASTSAPRSGRASRRSTTWSRSRSRRSTATARSTSSAAWSRRAPRSAIALYTGNDDHIVLDLVTPFAAMRDGAPVTVRFRGGLLGHWSVWTQSAVDLLERCKARRGRASRTAPSPPSCSRSTAASPTATAPSSTSPTTSAAASPAATRCCAGRACSKASGASIRPRA